MKKIKAYRVENQEKGNGIWRNFDGSLNPVFDKLSDGLAKSLPMEDNDFYRFNGKSWFSACDKKEKLTKWFSKQDVIEMLSMGYKVYEYEITEYRVVSEYEICFTRESILTQREIEYKEIWRC